MASLLEYVFLSSRDQIDWPSGDNDTDTNLDGSHFPIDVLEDYGYRIFDNGTMSNGSKCFLTFKPYVPAYIIEKNGTFVNSTSCQIALNPIGTRGTTGIAMAVLFGLTMILILTCLTKHGRQHLPREKRFYPIGRRWQWYWGIFVCGCALVSLFLNIDIDRFRVQGIPMIVTVFFWYLMCMGITAVTWEAVRHWGSWQERQYIDPNPFALSDEDRRSKIEFYLPLVFYFFLWMNFFLVIPRNWNFLQRQNDPIQQAALAEPGGTSVRFKAGAFLLFVAWTLIPFSLWHSIHHYKPRHRGLFNRAIGLVRAMPIRFVLIIPLSLAVVAYQAFISFDFQMSIMKKDGPIGVIFGWGYGVMLAILLIQVIYGYASPNEDKELIQQRRVRGDELDRELGLVRRPAWWRRVKGEHIKTSFRDKLRRNVDEVGQGQGRGTGRRLEGDMERNIREDMEGEARDEDGYGIEMQNYGRQDNNPRVDRAGVRNIGRESRAPFPGLNPESDRMVREASGLLFPDADDAARREREEEAEKKRKIAFLSEDGPPPPSYYDNVDSRGRAASGIANRPSSSGRSNSTGTLQSLNSPPAQVRSMLDID